jgi:hypothetical protein
MTVHMELIHDKLNKFEVVWLPTNTKPLSIAAIVVYDQLWGYPIAAQDKFEDAP